MLVEKWQVAQQPARFMDVIFVVVPVAVVVSVAVVVPVAVLARAIRGAVSTGILHPAMPMVVRAVRG